MCASNIRFYTFDEAGVTYDQIHEVIFKAHERNRNKGLYYRTVDYTGEQIKNKIGNGATFVALDDKTIVATGSVGIHTGKSWYDKGLLVAHYCFDAVLPEYQRKGIMTAIDKLRDEFSANNGVSVIRSGTAEKNYPQRQKFDRQGFIPVDYQRFSGNSFFSVLYAKWTDKDRKPSRFNCFLHYEYKKLITRLRFFISRVFRKVGL